MPSPFFTSLSISLTPPPQFREKSSLNSKPFASVMYQAAFLAWPGLLQEQSQPCLQRSGWSGFLSGCYFTFFFSLKYPIYCHPIVLHIPDASLVPLTSPRPAHSAFFVLIRADGQGERVVREAGSAELQMCGEPATHRPAAPLPPSQNACRRAPVQLKI